MMLYEGKGGERVKEVLYTKETNEGGGVVERTSKKVWRAIVLAWRVVALRKRSLACVLAPSLFLGSAQNEK
jgi:hypothetical protein